MNAIILYYTQLRDARIGYALLVNHDKREYVYYGRVSIKTFFDATPEDAFVLEQHSIQSVRNLRHYLILRDYLETNHICGAND